MKTTRKIISEFIGRASAHGYGQIKESSNLAGKITWGLIIIAAVTMLSYHLSSLLITFLAYDKSTNIHEDVEAVVFPQLLLCNTKQWTHIRPTIQYKKMHQQLMSEAKHLLKENTTQQHHKFANDVLKESLASNAVPELKKSVILKENMIVYCKYHNEECGPQNFTYEPTGIYGACYRFNPPVLSNLKASFEGGLQLLIYIEDAQNQEVLNHLVTSKGILLYALFPGYHANMRREVPLGIPTGYLTNVGFTFTKIERIETPTDKCQNDAEVYDLSVRELVKYNYSFVDCIDQKIAVKVFDKCKCVSSQLATPKELKDKPHCLDIKLDNSGQIANIKDLVTNYECEEKVIKVLEREDHKDEKPCLKACHKRDIGREVSSIAIPEEKVVTDIYYADVKKANASSTLSADLNKLKDIMNSTANTFTSSKAITQNLLQLNAFIRSGEVITYRESRAYPFVSFISEAGGVIGLWVGASCISMFEFFHLFGLLICSLFSRRKTEPSNNWKFLQQQQKQLQMNKIAVENVASESSSHRAN